MVRTVSGIEFTTAIEELGSMLSDQLRQIATEQRKTNELLRDLKNMLSQDCDDGMSEFPS